MRRWLKGVPIAVAVAAAALVGCAEEDSAPAASGRPSTGGLLDCYARFAPAEDCDADTVVNQFDRYPAADDRSFDFDGDGIADFLDTFYGDNDADADGDGLVNGFDAQPYAAPPGGVAVQPPATISRDQLSRQLLLDQLGRKFTAELVGPEPDRDYDGIPDDVDTTPTQFTNDRDGDGDQDFYDPEPGDPYVDSRNDPYDPRNDEYWED
ncbi:hypothetical protein NODU109028_04750 [Nocardioides dubius]|uniref:hypothetical protein n=1 Tax=Nocardioides dubius TaxID=317019 RepID=UPI0031D30A6C